MDAKEVLSHVSNLDKASKEKLPAAHFVDLLKSLKSGVVATEKLLRETKVGMVVGKLRTHPDKSVSELAKEIVIKWKHDVQSKAKPRSTTSPVASQHPSTPPRAVKSEPKSKVDPSSRNTKTDRVDTQVTGDKTRDNCVGIVYNGLCLHSDAPADRLISLAKSIEHEVFIAHKRKIEAQYKRKIQSIFLNLKDKNNPNFKKRVISGEISPARLATMESKDMASDQRKAEDRAVEEENMRNAMVPVAQRSISDQLQCGKCGKKKVSYTQAQTRSADEPMTTFCTCTHCGNMWKFS